MGCSSAAQSVPQKNPTCRLPKSAVAREAPQPLNDGTGDRTLGAGLFDIEAGSDATLDLIDLVPEPHAGIPTETMLRARLRYSIDRQPNARYALYAQFRLPGDTSLFDGSISKETSPPVDRNADVVDLTLPLSHVMNDERLAKPIQVKFVLTQYISNQESIVIAETDYFELG